MIYGEELRQSILAQKARLQETIADRQRRINNWETDEDDCFISSHVNSTAIHECEQQLRILDAGGVMDFDAIFDEDGNEVYVHWVNTKFGGAYVGRGIFASSIKALLKKTGWTMKTIKVPCWTKIRCYGSGMCGVMNSYVDVMRWHTNMATGEYVGYPEG